MSRIRVMIIEADYYARYAFYSLLSQDRRTTVIDEARDIDEAEWLFVEANGKHVSPDVIVFDADLDGKGRDPIDSVRQLVRLKETCQSTCRIVCCAMEPTLPFVKAAVEAGVDAILKKEEVASGIAHIVDKVHKGIFCYTRTVSERAFGRVQFKHHTDCYLVPPRREVPLSRGLERVARLYCEDNMTAAEIAEILHLSESGVRRQIQKIYQILGVNDRKSARSKLRYSHSIVTNGEAVRC